YTHFEWYVPADENTHHYVQTMGHNCPNDDARNAFVKECHEKWIPLSFHGFNDDDIWAREAGQDFYKDERGWLNERLYEPDIAIVQWRRFASKHNRGIQTQDHLYQ